MSSSVSVEDARRRKILAAACASHALPHDVSMGQVARRKRTHHARRGTYDLLTAGEQLEPAIKAYRKAKECGIDVRTRD